MGIGLLSGREWNNTYSGGYSPFSAKGDKFAKKGIAKFVPEYFDSGGVQTAKSDRNRTTEGTATAYSCSAAASFRRDALIGRTEETEKEEIRCGREEEMSDDPEESESDSKADIIVKPDGTRVLVITTNIGGMEMTMNLKIAEPTNEPYEMGEKI